MFIILIVLMAMVLLPCAYIKTYQITYSKNVHFSICQLYVSKAVFKSRGEDGELKGIPLRYVELLSNAGIPQEQEDTGQ